MILPTIVRSTQESLLSVQGGLREGAYALGTSKVRTIFKIVLPSAAGGIVTAIILAIGRVVSESAVLLLTINMVVNKVPESLMSPGTSLALDIYYFASHGYPDEAAATEASEGIQVLAAYTLQEAQIENLVTAKGYKDCVAFMGENGVSIVVSTESGELTATDVAKITDIAISETGLSAGGIKIMATN